MKNEWLITRSRQLAWTLSKNNLRIVCVLKTKKKEDKGKETKDGCKIFCIEKTSRRNKVDVTINEAMTTTVLNLIRKRDPILVL